MRLPKKQNVSTNNPENPLQRYYQPFIRYFYIERLKMALNFLKPQDKQYDKILEVGYGSGVFFPELTKICKKLYGLEVFPEAKKETEQMMEKENIQAELTTGSVTQMPFADDFFDAIVCVSALEHLQPNEMEKAISEIKRVTKNNGLIILGFPSGRKLMQLYCILIKRDLHFDFHRSDHNLILKTITKNFPIQETKKLFSFLPIYYVVKCQKK
ncbi:MAG: class I SAM-dependent methyltransferase [Patescibacteria group bacterium]|nr:class I SAM-dependent methyltransferase [Patescibacteria group bacterium]MBU2472865.1 class I SAM-dependent methyltransferase [Patescibacteria group bacterium]